MKKPGEARRAADVTLFDVTEVADDLLARLPFHAHAFDEHGASALDRAGLRSSGSRANRLRFHLTNIEIGWHFSLPTGRGLI